MCLCLDGGDGDWERAGGYPALRIPNMRPEHLRLRAWQGELLAWSMRDDRLFARPAGPAPQPWGQVGSRHPKFLKHW